MGRKYFNKFNQVLAEVKRTFIFLSKVLFYSQKKRNEYVDAY